MLLREGGASFIFPSNDSMTRCRPLLRGVPRVGSPTSQLVLRHSDSRPPPRLFACRSRFAVVAQQLRQAVGSPKFLDCPCQRAMLSDPGAGSGLCLFGDESPTLDRLAIAFRMRERVGQRNITLSGLNDTARRLAVYASQPGLPSVAAQDSLPAGGTPIRAGLCTQVPHWAATESFRRSPFPFPKLRLAHPTGELVDHPANDADK